MKVMVETSARIMSSVSEADLGSPVRQGRCPHQQERPLPAWPVRLRGEGGSGWSQGHYEDVHPGPHPSETQVEISLTDARKLGVTAPIRESGDLEGTPGCVLRGPAGEVTLEKGVIAAKRHIHFNPDEAKEAGVVDKQVVSVKVDYNGRSLIFGDVVCRVSPKYALAMHVDTDESNAAALPGTVDGEIIL